MQDDLQGRIEATTRVLWDASVLAEMTITGDGRVGEADAATLLGYTPGHLRNLRTEGQGPTHYRRGVGGARVSYRLAELARWIEEGEGE